MCFYVAVQAENCNACFYLAIKEIMLQLLVHVKTCIEVFRLDHNLKVRMIEHSFLGQSQDESDTNIHRIL